MILNLCFDEKFIDYAISHYNDAGVADDHEFMVIIPDKDYELKLIKQKDKVVVLTDSKKNLKKLQHELYKYDAIIFHSLFLAFFDKILHTADTSKIKLVWMFWGGEFYDNPVRKNKYLSIQSKTLRKRNPKYFLHLIKRKVKKMIGMNSNKDLSKIKYFTSEIDYKIVCKEMSMKATLFPYYYYTIEETVGKDLMDKSIEGTNIFVGNSATLTNNHLDVFSVLQGLNLDEQTKIIVPLSYAGEEWYIKLIADEGKRIFGDKFVPLLSYMERNEYNNYLFSCGIVIMNHYRQQAHGNVITALWLGAKVYMNERSPIYCFYKKKGVILFNIKDLQQNNPELFIPLSKEKIKYNRNILNRMYSHSKMIEDTRNLTNELMTK